MPPTDSNSLKDDTQSCPAPIERNAEKVRSTASDVDTRYASVRTDATVPASILAGVVSLRYNPRRIRSSCANSETRP
jgi:hypothetical protein